MKRIDDLTTKELAALTYDEIQKYIDIECLHDGVPLIPGDEPDMPTVVKPEPDATVYKVGNFEFADEESALSVVSALLHANRVDTRYNSISGESFHTIGTPYSDPSVETKKAFSKDAWADAQKQVKEYSAQMSAYRELKAAYDEAMKARESVSTRVWNVVNEARREQAERESLVRTFQKYLQLAEDDRETAWKFFVQAHPQAMDYDGLEEELTADE